MPFFLNDRDTQSRERMDDPKCSQTDLFNTYRQFSTINAIISGWKTIYKKKIKPILQTDRVNSLLDIGFGGGDIPIKLASWADDDGLELEIIGIETDPRAMAFVQTVESPKNISFKLASSTDLLKKEHRFDIVISNHLLHHLTNSELGDLLLEAKKLSTKRVLFNDIERSDTGYVLFNLFSRPVFQSSFITEDGLTSIKRSYTFRELENAIPDDWTIQRLFPFRLLLQYTHSSL